MERNKPLELVQGSMLFLASIAHGLEELVGRGAPGITFRAGQTIALQSDIATRETDLLKAIEEVTREMERLGLRWDVEVYKKQSEPEYITEDNGEHLVKLVFGNCMVRSCQFHYGHPQRNSLCLLNHGLFCGLLQKIYGALSDYEFIHSGENACIGLLRVKPRRAE